MGADIVFENRDEGGGHDVEAEILGGDCEQRASRFRVGDAKGTRTP